MYNDATPKLLSIQTHLPLDELETRYRRAKDPVARSHWQTIWLPAQGWASAQVAAVTGYSVNWVRTIARRYNQLGPAGLKDRRHRNPGAAGLLSAAQCASLLTALEQPPPDGGVLSAVPYLKKLGVTSQRLIYTFDFKGARFIFLWSGKYDYRSPSGWDGDRPKYAEQMQQLQQCLDEAKAQGIRQAFIIVHYPVFARSGLGPIPAPDNPQT
jgi:hypothetical protein